MRRLLVLPPFGASSLAVEEYAGSFLGDLGGFGLDLGFRKAFAGEYGGRFCPPKLEVLWPLEVVEVVSS